MNLIQMYSCEKIRLLFNAYLKRHGLNSVKVNKIILLKNGNPVSLGA